jgi:enoyl-CoA hydratase/carnithine racemase
MSDRVILTITDGVADVRMNRADKRNALDGAMFQALADVGERLKSEPGVRVVVLSGEGSSFCAGLDFSSFQMMAGGDRPPPDETSPGAMEEGRITHLGQQVCWVWQEIPVPVIAAVHGTRSVEGSRSPSAPTFASSIPTRR